MNNHDRNEQQPLKAIAAIAHDINNKLTGVIGGIELTVSLLPDGDVAARNNLRESLKSAYAIKQLTKKLSAPHRSQLQANQKTIDLDNNNSNKITLTTKSHNEHILVVDDDEVVRETLKQILESLGYHVTVVRSPGDALICLEKFSPFNLIITDIMMPYMDGGELAQRVHKLYPHTAVVFVSGLATAIDNDLAKRLAGPIISKPISMFVLAQVVEENIHQTIT